MESNNYIFDDIHSLFHFLLGVVIVFSPKALGIMAGILFVIYQVKEHENPISTLGDLVEFCLGILFGLLL